MNYAFELQRIACENEVQARVRALMLCLTGRPPIVWILKLDLRRIVLAEQDSIHRGKVFR